MITLLVGGIKILFGVVMGGIVLLLLLIALLGMVLDLIKWIFDIK